MKVLLTDYPKDADILRCKNRALRTVMGSKESTVMPTESWLHRICDAEHSPIRTMEYRFTLLDVPYWVSNELCRHHIGIEKFVSSQRNDRQKSYDRNSARQDAPVNIDIDINTEALMTLAHKRLCRKATNEMQQLVGEMCRQAEEVSPWLNGLLVPMCVYRGGCHEMQPCGRMPYANID